MTSQNLYYFTQIVEDMNLTVTSNRLYTSQQNLSGHIKRLEKYFGVPLFKRKPALELTEQGRLLYREAKQILAIEQRLFERFGTSYDQGTKTLRVVCSQARSRFYLPQVISRYTEKHPEVNLVVLDELKYRQALQNGKADLAIGRMKPNEPGIVSIPLVTTGGCVVVAEALLRRCFGKKTAAFIEKASAGLDLNALPNTIPIIHTGSAGDNLWLVDEVPELAARSRLYVDAGNPELLLSLCRDGKGILLISEMYASYIKNTYSDAWRDGILFFPHNVNGRRLMTVETIAYLKQERLHSYFKDFIDLVEQAFGDYKQNRENTL